MKVKNCMFGENPSPLENRADELRAELRSEDPDALAARTGSIYTPARDSSGEFKLVFWNQEAILSFPGLIASDAHSEKPLNPFDQALLLYYFHISDGTPQSGEWISFTELPDGKFYAQAFQGYTGSELLKTFGNDSDAFMEANENLNGRREFFANISYSYQVLPRLALMVACWLGDEDFPASYRILFDAAAGYHLSTDGCAILGGQLARRLIKAKST